NEMHWLSIAVNHHPALSAFIDQISADSQIMKLFPEETPESGKHGFTTFNTGSGSGVQLSMLALDLLRAGYQTLRARETLTHASFVEQVTSGLENLRTLQE